MYLCFMKEKKPASKIKTIFTYAITVLMVVILIGAIVSSFIFSGVRLQVIWLGAALLIVNLLVMLFFVGKNMR